MFFDVVVASGVVALVSGGGGGGITIEVCDSDCLQSDGVAQTRFRELDNLLQITHRIFDYADNEMSCEGAFR